MKKSTKKLIFAFGIMAPTIITSVAYLNTKRLVKIAIEREAPKRIAVSKKKISGAGKKNVNPESLITSGQKLKYSGCETIEIKSHDGIRLVGHWHKCDNPKRVIIAMHGWRSSWSRDFGVISDFWHKNNCNVLYVEQRAQGNSDGAYISFGLMERFDCLDWVNWVNENGCEKLPIYLGGVSMGASTVLMASGLNLPKNVRGIIADCGYTSPYAIWNYVMQKNLGMPYGRFSKALASDLCKRKMHMGPEDYSCTEALSKSHVPVLFIHGTDDRFVPVEMTYENYKACASPKRLLIVPGAGHGMSYLVDKKSYEEDVKQFWADYDY